MPKIQWDRSQLRRCREKKESYRELTRGERERERCAAREVLHLVWIDGSAAVPESGRGRWALAANAGEVGVLINHTS